MEWARYAKRVYLPRMMKNSNGEVIEFEIGKDDEREKSVYLICANYRKNFTISNYAVYFQNRLLVKSGGANFVMKISDCSNPREGRRIAERHLEQLKNDEIPKTSGGCYIGESSHLTGPFIDL